MNISNPEIKSVLKAENKAKDTPFIRYAKVQDFFQLIFVLSGEAEVVFNDTIITNKPGTVVFVPKSENAKSVLSA